MVGIADIEVEPDARGERAAGESNRARFAPFIALALVFLPLNAGTLLYTAKNAADVRESREALSAVKRSIDGLKLQIDKQARKVAKSDELTAIRQHVERLGKDVSALDGRMQSGLPASGGSLILSAPGKEVKQRLAPSPTTAAADLPATDDTSESGGEGLSVADLPRYERSVSPEGKLILRKVR